MKTTNEKVEAILMEGASIESMEAESRRMAAAGRMCIVFPTKELMNSWLHLISKP